MNPTFPPPLPRLDFRVGSTLPVRPMPLIDRGMLSQGRSPRAMLGYESAALLQLIAVPRVKQRCSPHPPGVIQQPVTAQGIKRGSREAAVESSTDILHEP